MTGKSNRSSRAKTGAKDKSRGKKGEVKNSKGHHGGQHELPDNARGEQECEGPPPNEDGGNRKDGCPDANAGPKGKLPWLLAHRGPRLLFMTTLMGLTTALMVKTGMPLPFGADRLFRAGRKPVLDANGYIMPNSETADLLAQVPEGIPSGSFLCAPEAEPWLDMINGGAGGGVPISEPAGGPTARAGGGSAAKPTLGSRLRRLWGGSKEESRSASNPLAVPVMLPVEAPGRPPLAL
mmetsp:Transcript_42648/g.96539  ORF Transcript_42648/g.96539 Transcript_42648/m.96539 type:complete len:237 (-) Transcript_42648:250-960(-)